MRRVAIFAALALTAAGCAGSRADGRGRDRAQGSPELDTAAEATGLPVERLTDCAQMTKGTTVLIVAVDNYFAPQCGIVRSDATIRVKNAGVRPHSFTVSEGAFREKPYRLDLDPVEGGAEARSEALNLEPGFYEFFCKYHHGMDGVLQVVDPVA